MIVKVIIVGGSGAGEDRGTMFLQISSSQICTIWYCLLATLADSRVVHDMLRSTDSQIGTISVKSRKKKSNIPNFGLGNRSGKSRAPHIGEVLLLDCLKKRPAFTISRKDGYIDVICVATRQKLLFISFCIVLLHKLWQFFLTSLSWTTHELASDTLFQLVFCG